jgi:hypothetical protein
MDVIDSTHNPPLLHVDLIPSIKVTESKIISTLKKLAVIMMVS